MGMNMARRLLRGGHMVVAYNRSPEKTERIAKEGAQAAYGLRELAAQLDPPRVVWLMLPAGRVVDEHIEELTPFLDAGDVVVDGGNSYYKDDLRRAEALSHKGIHYLDAGVSGGIWGLHVGYCLMIGGDREIFDRLRPLFETLALQDGYLYCGPTGAGHYVKMIHNGIEYGMMQAYAEGFALLEASDYRPHLDFARVARLWNHGSVIRSWLLELLEGAFQRDPELSEIRGYVEDSGEGRWTVQEAVERAVPAPVIAASLFQRFRSRQEDTFADRVLAALRREFGGHAVRRSG
jgi:6-phosphogluconate dehydrogenase